MQTHPQIWLPTSPLQTHTLGDRGVPHWEVEGTRPRLPVSRKRGPHRTRSHACPPLPSQLCVGTGTALWPAARPGGGHICARTAMSPSTLTNRAKGAVPSGNGHSTSRRTD